jgi:hypothetical protein
VPRAHDGIEFDGVRCASADVFVRKHRGVRAGKFVHKVVAVIIDANGGF